MSLDVITKALRLLIPKSNLSAVIRDRRDELLTLLQKTCVDRAFANSIFTGICYAYQLQEEVLIKMSAINSENVKEEDANISDGEDNRSGLPLSRDAARVQRTPSAVFGLTPPTSSVRFIISSALSFSRCYLCWTTLKHPLLQAKQTRKMVRNTSQREIRKNL